MFRPDNYRRPKPRVNAPFVATLVSPFVAPLHLPTKVTTKREHQKLN